jgi:putative DNA primase/helicase
MTDGDPVVQYLTGRGLVVPETPSLRYHPSLSYRDGNAYVGKFQAMIGLVTGADGQGTSIHRTYLQNGKKAEVSSAKKLMTPIAGVSGSAVRLFPVSPALGIAEGIESALGASMRFQRPVWSAISAHGMESFIPPEGVREVFVFADNDESMVGQKAAYALASRLSGLGIAASVEIPKKAGQDWADL